MIIQLKRKRIMDGNKTRELALVRDTFLLREDFYIVEIVGRQLEKLFDLKHGTMSKKHEKEIESMFHIQTNKKNERIFSDEEALIMFDIITKDI